MFWCMKCNRCNTEHGTEIQLVESIRFLQFYDPLQSLIEHRLNRFAKSGKNPRINHTIFHKWQVMLTTNDTEPQINIRKNKLNWFKETDTQSEWVSEIIWYVISERNFVFSKNNVKNNTDSITIATVAVNEPPSIATHKKFFRFINSSQINRIDLRFTNWLSIARH